MASLMTLPTEILSKIIAALPTRADIANSRLINKRLDEIAVELLFSNVTLYAHYFTEDGYRPPWPIDYHSRTFAKILDHEALKTYVKKVTIYTCETHCDHHPMIADDQCEGCMPAVQYDELWEQCFDRISEFSNLLAVTACFDRHTGTGGDDIYQSTRYRVREMGRLLRVLNGSTRHPLKSLAIRHCGPEFWDDEADALWDEVLSNLRSLRLSVVHEEYQPEIGVNIRVGEPEAFWKLFPTRMLQPCTSNLSTLVLYSDLTIGWFPKVDLRSVHFLSLRSLTLGHFLFSHDWQFDWIVSHSKTLRALYLDHCSILYQVGLSTRGWLDAEGYPVEITPDFMYEGDYYRSSLDLENDDYGEEIDKHTFAAFTISRWHEVLAMFAKDLAQLRDFRFGSSLQWDFEPQSRYTGSDGLAMPVIPWEAEQDIENEMFEDRYMHYDGWTELYAREWEYKSAGMQRVADEIWEAKWLAKMDPPPDCDAEDEVALEALLTAIAKHS